ncbi:hypothetical protein L218DRAFT_958525 [Marasmius fiardii PR-910]|nr:hypothetical protein L218DRAFT_958525 [Marasmius fiardii PR-910]
MTGVDWQSPEVIAHNADSFGKFVHVLLGLYAFEWFDSLDFEFNVLIGEHKFKWPLIFYFLNRYTVFLCLIALVASLNVQQQINCQGLYVFIQAMGNVAAGLACANLAIRTIAIWRNDLYVVIGLTLLILGHWAFVLRNVTLVKAQWAEGSGCIITNNEPALITGAYIYVIVVDFIVICLMAYKTGIRVNDRVRLLKILLLDGLLYFIVAFVANLLGVIFSALNLNPIMSVIAVVPATSVASIAACRAVRHLSSFEYRVEDIETIVTSNSQPTLDSIKVEPRHLTSSPFGGVSTITSCSTTESV